MYSKSHHFVTNLKFFPALNRKNFSYTMVVNNLFVMIYCTCVSNAQILLLIITLKRFFNLFSWKRANYKIWRYLYWWLFMLLIFLLYSMNAKVVCNFKYLQQQLWIWHACYLGSVNTNNYCMFSKRPVFIISENISNNSG